MQYELEKKRALYDVKWIAIENNLTSNYYLANLQYPSHPIRKWIDEGLYVVLGTDDPGIMTTNSQAYTLEDEFKKAVEFARILTYGELFAVVVNSIIFSFAEHSVKEHNISSICDEFNKFYSSSDFEKYLKEFENKKPQSNYWPPSL